MKKQVFYFVLLFSMVFTGSVAMSQNTVKAAGEDAGIYFFDNVGSGYSLTYSKDSGAVYQSVYTGDWDQQWEFQYTNDGYYRIAPVGNYITALGIDGSVSNGASLKCGTSTGADTQRWSISNVGSGAYVIRSKADPNYVIEMTETSSGTSARIWRYIAGDNMQKWYRSNNNVIRQSVNTVQNSASLKYMTASSTTVIEQSYSGSSSQRWQFTYSQGHYQISPMSNPSLAIYASPYSNAFITFSSNNYNWIVCKLTNGKVKICSRVNPEYVITRKIASNGAVSIVMEKYTGASAQLWNVTGY